MGGNNFTEEKLHFIKFMKLYLNFNAKMIKDHISPRNENGSKPRLSSINYWLQRLEETGDVKIKPKSGRPRKLEEREESNLIEKIKFFPKKRFSFIRRLGFLHLHRSTVNRYALRNGYSNNINIFFLFKKFSKINFYFYKTLSYIFY